MGLRVRAVVLFEFQCPKCTGWYPESNPLECPHQEGRGVKYKPAKGDKIINVTAVLRKLGLDETRVKPATQGTQAEPVPVQTSAPVFTSMQDIVDSACPRGT